MNWAAEGCASSVCTPWQDGKHSGWDGRRRARGPPADVRRRGAEAHEGPAVTKLSIVGVALPLPVLEWSVNHLLPSLAFEGAL